MTDTVASSLGPDLESPKTLGAFYTDVQVADFLVWWAVRSRRDRVMDPSFGGGVFLRSACRRIADLGGHPAAQVYGVEIDQTVYRLIIDKLTDEFALGDRTLWQQDFFDVSPLPANQVDAIVGNPPFIRYQRFSGELRERAIKRALDQDVVLSELASSWAAFVVHSIAFLRKGGRLAMVLPAEIGHASYAVPVLRYIAKSFGRVTLLTFRKKLFAGLSEDTLLLLAEDKGTSPCELLTRDLAHAGLLAQIREQGQYRIRGARRLDALALVERKERLIHHLVSKKARELYRELASLPKTKRLGDIADVGIGYVTGANSFFHLSPADVEKWHIPERYLKLAVRRGRALTGIAFTRADWRVACEKGEAGYLLSITTGSDLPEEVLRYLHHGEIAGVHKSFKCRTRTPWFAVPHVYQPDAFLTYMSGDMPRLVTNQARAVAPNSLHVLRLHPSTELESSSLAALWLTSLTRLSVEMEGHALGGGMLKLEPTEAENVIIATGDITNGTLAELAGQLDALLRRGDLEQCQRLTDERILRRQLGLSKADCRLLYDAGRLLRDRRYQRSNAQ